MSDNKVIVEALKNERDELQAQIINLAGRQELEVNSRVKSQMSDQLTELRSKADKVSNLISKHSE